MREKKQINIRVGRNIQRAREKAKYTQEELSEILDITPNHLSAIERGASGATLELIEKICHLFGVTADFLLFGHNREDEYYQELAAQLSMIETEYRPQVRKILAALLEIFSIQENHTKHDL